MAFPRDAVAHEFLKLRSSGGRVQVTMKDPSLQLGQARDPTGMFLSEEQWAGECKPCEWNNGGEVVDGDPLTCM